MIDGIPALGHTDRPAPLRKVAAPARLSNAGGAADLSFPETPPAEALEALDTAQRIMSELGSRELRFSVAHDHDDGEIHLRVVTSEGLIVREIPARDALEILSGDPAARVGVDTLG